MHGCPRRRPLRFTSNPILCLCLSREADDSSSPQLAGCATWVRRCSRARCGTRNVVLAYPKTWWYVYIYIYIRSFFYYKLFFQTMAHSSSLLETVSTAFARRPRGRCGFDPWLAQHPHPQAPPSVGTGATSSLPTIQEASHHASNQMHWISAQPIQRLDYLDLSKWHRVEQRGGEKCLCVSTRKEASGEKMVS